MSKEQRKDVQEEIELILKHKQPIAFNMRKLWFLSHEKLYWIFHTLVHSAARQGSSVPKHNFEKPANVSNVSAARVCLK